MTVADSPSTLENEAGTAPEDRKFRPDVQGLRAVAVVLVVLFHAGVSGVSGGYVGVDVFFVISGFVITGVLLRERSFMGSTSILTFYARRCRRILPAATLTIVITIALSFAFLGELSGYRTAIDARWAAVFLVNFHFAAEGTNYLASQQLPSPLQNFWSLSVEEQFYLVYPTLFLVLASLRTRVSSTTRLVFALGIVIVVSFGLSVAQTASNPTVAFFSPFTRAWELALGGLVAVGTKWLLRIPSNAAAAMTWLGLGAIMVAAFTFNSLTAYPGSLVAIPVVGTALIISGGVAAPRHGAESLLRLRPFGWLGDLSYSLYLWHWPIFIIAAESQGKVSLSFIHNLPWLGLALVAAVISYALVENPIRHASLLSRSRRSSIALGVILIAITVTIATIVLRGSLTASGSSSRDRVTPGTAQEVAALVRASTQINMLPSNLTPSVKEGAIDYGWPPRRCSLGASAETESSTCVFGDPFGDHTMVLYGDSHALMWFEAMDNIAIRAHWRLYIMGHDYCMANEYPPASFTSRGLIPEVCSRWQRFAYHRIRKIDPALIVITQEHDPGFTTAQWQRGMKETLDAVKQPNTKLIVLGNIPIVNVSPPDCLAEHPDAVQTCSGSPSSGQAFNRAEQRAVTAEGGRYISVTPWFCSQRCSAVVGHYQVYTDELHVTGTYSVFLQDVLARKLELSRL